MSSATQLLATAIEQYGQEIQALIEQRCRLYNTNSNRYSDYLIELREVKSLTPSQSGEDYDNESSRETARRIATGTAIQNRIEDIFPILIEEDGRIIDGNHRHCAATINEEHKMWTLRVEPSSAKSNRGVGRVINWEDFLLEMHPSKLASGPKP